MVLLGPVLLWTHGAAGAAVLQVNKVVQVVPDALDAQEGDAVSGIAVPSQSVNKEVLLDAPAPRQNQNPAVDPEPSQGVSRPPALTFLLRTRSVLYLCDY